MSDNTEKKPTQSVSLTVTVDNPDDWKDVFGMFTEFAGDLPKEYAGISVSSYNIGAIEEPEVQVSTEYHDENTLFKARDAILGLHVTGEMADGMLTALLNAGILLREHRP